jgi:hypothetical protein
MVPYTVIITPTSVVPKAKPGRAVGFLEFEGCRVILAVRESRVNIHERAPNQALHYFCDAMFRLSAGIKN